MSCDARAVVRALMESGQTLAVAESLTGGMIAQTITQVPGCSAVFCGGVVSYQSRIKSDVLGVDPLTLQVNGPASRPVAKAMAEGVRRLLKADLALAVTGVAGPDPDEFGAPVGLVYAALAGDGWCLCRQLNLTGGRALIRELTCQAALDLLGEQLGLQ